jgi:peptidoglycan/xylan/chitin deacetylase (PgdA/CDA1 family)
MRLYGCPSPFWKHNSKILFGGKQRLRLAFKDFVLLGSVMLVILSCVIIIGNESGEIDNMIVFGQTDDGKDIGDESKEASNNDDKKLAIITFDDGKKGQIKYAKQILDTYGYPATFSIICNNVSMSDHLNWPDIQQLEKDGYDIASHSMSHTELEDVPMDTATYEISESKKCLLENGVGNVKVFTYPKNGGSDNPAILKEVAKHYEMARTGNDPLAFLKCSSTNSSLPSLPNKKINCPSLEYGTDYGKYSIIGWSHDSEREDNGYNDEQMLQRFIDVVESQSRYNDGDDIGAIPIIIYHDIDTASGLYTTSFELFKSEMKYLKDNGFMVISLLDLI